MQKPKERNIEFLNCGTGEVTQNHREAVYWYREGNAVDVILNGKRVVTWEVNSQFNDKKVITWVFR